jgi:hypothetical protein
VLPLAPKYGSVRLSSSGVVVNFNIPRYFYNAQISLVMQAFDKELGKGPLVVVWG